MNYNKTGDTNNKKDGDLKERTADERVALCYPSKKYNYFQLEIYTYDNSVFDLFQEKCKNIFGEKLNCTTSSNFDGCLFFRLEIKGDKQFIVQESKRIAYEIDMEFKLDNGLADNINHYLGKIIIPIYFICKSIKRNVSNFLWDMIP